MDLHYGMWDADNHLYETTDALTRHLPSHREKDLFWVTDDRGHRHLILDKQWWDYIPNPTFDPVSRAGSLTEMLAGEKSRDQVQLDGMRIVESLSLRPEYVDREARITKLDEQGVDACVLFPTLASGIEEYSCRDISLMTDVLWAFNRWLEEEWGFHHHDRLFATPIMSMAEHEQTLPMLDWVIERGCRAIDVRAAPVPTPSGLKSPGDPMFDPFWARCAEAGILVCVHLGESGYFRHSGDWTGNYRRQAFSMSSFEQIYMHGRPISDFMTAIVCHGVLTRHPKLRVVSVENGSDWVPHLVDRFKMFYQRYPGQFPEDPVEAFERNVWVSPFWEEDLDVLRGYVPLEHILAGSDFPHAEGLAEPTDYVKGLLGFSPEDERRVMRDNLRSLLAGS